MYSHMHRDRSISASSDRFSEKHECILNALRPVPIQIIDCATDEAIYIPGRIHSWTTVLELKRRISKEMNYLLDQLSLFLCNQDIEDTLSIADLVSNSQDTSRTIFLNLKLRSQFVHQKTDKASISDFSQMILDDSISSQSVHKCAQELPVCIFGTLKADSAIQECLKTVNQGQLSDQAPKLSEDGTSGAYILRQSESNAAAVFKPIDEEQFAPNNPRSITGLFGQETCRPGVKSGESTIREVIAYMLDYQGFSGVPPTTLVEMSHQSFVNEPINESSVISQDYMELLQGLVKFEFTRSNDQNSCQQLSHGLSKSFLNSSKQGQDISLSSSLCDEDTGSCLSSIKPKVGSLQQFVKNIGPIENFAPEMFNVDEIHKIAVLDLRLCNLDRNACNILVSNSEPKTLIPIDHGLSLPDSLEVCSYDLAWLSFPQAEEPFSPKTQEFIAKIDIEQDINLIESTFKIRPECLRNMKVTTLLLKRSAARGLNLQQIGQIFCRPDEDDQKPSLLEKIVQKASLCASLKNKMQTKIKDCFLINSNQDIDTNSENDHFQGIQETKSLKNLILAQFSNFNLSENDCASSKNCEPVDKSVPRQRIMSDLSPEYKNCLETVDLQEKQQEKKKINIISQVPYEKELSFQSSESLHLSFDEEQSAKSYNRSKMIEKVDIEIDFSPKSFNDNDKVYKSRQNEQQSINTKEFRRTASHCGVYQSPIKIKRSLSPSENLQHLSGKQMRHKQTLNSQKRINLAKKFLDTVSNKNIGQTLRCQRTNFEEKVRQQIGGPHDKEFFACFSQYLEETINQVLGEKVSFESTANTSRNRSLSMSSSCYDQLSFQNKLQ